MIYFKNANIIDGRGGLFRGNLLVEKGKISAINGELPSGAQLLDCEGKYLMPGLINSHVHICSDPEKDFGDRAELSDAKRTLMALTNLRSHLRAGITYVRDLGGYNFVELDVRDAVKAGEFEAAEMVGSGRYVTMTGGHGWRRGRECDGPHEARKAAREQFRAGADLLKVMATGGVMTPGVEPGAAQMTVEEMTAAIEEAKKRGAKSATHAQGTQGIKNAILAGVDSVEHGIFLDDEAIEMMLEREVVLVPTLVAPFYIVEMGEEAGIPAYAVNKAKSVMDAHFESFKKAVKAGVKIAMGTDSGTPFNPHGSVVKELLFMEKGGMSPMEVLEAATYRAAQLLDIDRDYGSLEEGKVADLLLLDSNPLEDLTALESPRVFKRGKEFI